MAYITRNANILLLFLILISAGALVAATVFFQENFDRLNRAYKTKLTQLNEVTDDLAEKQAALEQIKNELTLRSAREEEFTQQYTDVRQQKTKLETEKTQLTQAKQSLEERLSSKEALLQTTQNALEASQGENERLTADLAKAEEDIQRLKSRIDDKDAKIACLQAKADAEENTC